MGMLWPLQTRRGLAVPLCRGTGGSCHLVPGWRDPRDSCAPAARPDEDSNLDPSPLPDLDSESCFPTREEEEEEEERWLDALEKGELDDNGELKKEVDESLLTARQVRGPGVTGRPGRAGAQPRGWRCQGWAETGCDGAQSQSGAAAGGRGALAGL